MMSCTVKCLMLPMVLLFVWRLQEVAQACSCIREHPQMSFCQADVVIKATVLARKDVGGFDKPRMYTIKQDKMFKGPNRDFDVICTAASSAACGVNLNNGVQYLLSGRLAPDGSLHVGLCNFFAPWDSLSTCEKTNFIYRYRKGCDCKITPCYAVPCRITTPAECLWTDFLTNTGEMEQTRHSACLKRSDGSCAWFKENASPKQGVKDSQRG
uniref:metalloproteinase inhibitor 2-like n=1 Tax=Doryrhamphus excisus TaxID=161450 RepID=UPI0025AE562A|nr:metalloproteinase inhibitor 2-like [Doryrhamphus excisus]